MKLDLIFQSDENNTLLNEVVNSFNKEPKKAYFFCAFITKS